MWTKTNLQQINVKWARAETSCILDYNLFLIWVLWTINIMNQPRPPRDKNCKQKLLFWWWICTRRCPQDTDVISAIKVPEKEEGDFQPSVRTKLLRYISLLFKAATTSCSSKLISTCVWVKKYCDIINIIIIITLWCCFNVLILFF